MQAIIQLSGKQFRVKTGTKLRINRIAGNVGDTIECTDILAAFDENGEIFNPDATRVSLTVLAHELGAKCQIFKKIRRHGYQRLRGHRQHETRVQIDEVAAKTSDVKKTAKKE